MKPIEPAGKIRPEYQKMINNLLGIRGRDNAVLLGRDVKGIGDLLPNPQAVYQRKEFNIEIKPSVDSEIADSLRLCKDFKEFEAVSEQEGYQLSAAQRRKLRDDFDDASERIVDSIVNNRDLFLAQWKKFKQKYEAEQIQRNSWPLYVGTMIISTNARGSGLRAPLVLRRAEIVIKDNRVYLSSYDDSAMLNEKLAFLINKEYALSLPRIEEDQKVSLEEACQKYAQLLMPSIGAEFVFNPDFTYAKKDEVKGSALQYADGLVLMTAQPSGGKLRDKFIELVEEEVLDDLLDEDIMNSVAGEVDGDIWKGTNSILRITPTDLSQERAIMASLRGSTIIWGPPGTGKSQTISNILANLLIKKKTVLITSEKKAALDVIRTRMGSLSKYLFFALADKSSTKEEFYKDLKALQSRVSITGLGGPRKDYSPHPLIPLSERAFYEQNAELCDIDLDKLAEAVFFLKENPGVMAFARKDLEILYAQKDMLVEACSQKNLNEVLARRNFPRRGFWIWKRYAKEIEGLIADKKRMGDRFYDVGQLLENFEKDTVARTFHVDEYIEKERRYQETKAGFNSDERFLEDALATQFRERLERLMKDPEKTKAVKSFWRGAGSGFRKPFSFLRQHSQIIKELFTVFVSTPQTLADFIDMDKNYDVAIFDEASQMHLEKGLPFVAMCKRSVISGDDQQMQPSKYFEVRDETELIEESEETAESLLEYANRKNLPKFMLTKNYRAKASELMAFSSVNFYNGNLDAVDQHGFKGKVAVEVYDAGGKWENQMNKKEAELALQRVLKELGNQDLKSVEVILLALNSKQKEYLENLIYSGQKEYEPLQEAIEVASLKLRSLENVQGDEADVVVVSVAYDKNARLGTTYVCRPEGRNALNVAISRARYKMVVFKSIHSKDAVTIKPNNSIVTFQKWLNFLELSVKEKENYLLDHKAAKQEEAVLVESTFEQDVYEALRNSLTGNNELGIITQYKVGSYSIDIAIINNKTNRFLLGVEVDGYIYHNGFQKHLEDKERQNYIESKGYKLARVTSLDWKLNKNTIPEKLFARAQLENGGTR